MAKSKDVKKEVKKEAAKTPKEKKAEKRNKKPSYEQYDWAISFLSVSCLSFRTLLE